MLLVPKNTKYKKYQKQKIKGLALSNNFLINGSIGLKALESGRISAKQIEACRKILSRHTKKIAKYWINIFPHYPVTAKPLEVRMGKGKGNVKFWVSKVKKGNILFELKGLPEFISIALLRKVAHKLSVNTNIIFKYK